jgi:PAS domain S-box-containing protein
MPFRKIKLKQILLLALCLHLIMLVAGFGVWSWIDFQESEDKAAEELEAAGLLLDEHVLRSFAAIDGALLQTADMVQEMGVASLPSEAAWRRMRSIARPLPISGAIFLYDRDGNPIGSSASYPFTTTNVSDRQYFQELIAGKAEYFIGKALQGRSVHKLFFPIARSIKGTHGRVEAVAQVGVEADYIADLFTKVDLHGKTFGLYKASDGTLVVRHPVTERHLGETIVSQPFFTEITNGRPRWTGWVPGEDGRQLLSARTMSELPVILTASMKSHDVFDHAYTQLRWRSLALVVAIAALAILGFMLLKSAQREASIREKQKRAEEDLRLSEQRFRMALRNAPVSVAVQDLSLKYVWAYNQRTARPEEIVGRFDTDIFTPEEAAHLTAIKRRVIQDNVEVQEEMWLNRSSGPRFLNVFWEPIRDEGGKVVGVGNATVDLTAMKTAEDALRQSEERYRGLFNSMIEGFCVIEMIFDPDGKPVDYRFIEANPMFETLTGLKDVPGKRIREILPGNEEHWYEVYGKVALTGEPARFARFAEALGRWYEVNAYRVNEPPLGRVAILFNDITERKHAEQALRESESKLRLALDAAYLISFEWDIPANEVRRFASAEPSLEATPMDKPGTFEQVCEAVHPDDRQAFIMKVHAALEREDGEYESEFRVVRPGGDVAWLYERGRVERDSTGRPLRLIGLSQDITSRKLAENVVRDAKENLERIVAERTAELFTANRELEQRAGQLRQLAGELTMTEQRERKRLAKILHDGLQQHLVAAKLQVGGLVHPVNDKETNETATRVESILDDALKVSRTLAAELSPPILHDSGLLAGLEWLSRWMSDRHGMKVEVQTEQADAPRMADDVKAFLFEAVRELLLNVLKHAGTKSARIHLATEGGSTMRITVSDNGVGFDAASLLDTGKTIGGFGLFSIRERIALIGGGLHCDTSPGMGTKLTLTAPLEAPILQDEAPPERGRRKTGRLPDPSPREGKIRILLVDDHAVMREGLARLLAQEPDFEVVGQASDGKEAIEQATSLIPDVLLMDISMPGMSGMEATKVIHQQHPGIRIIGLSLYTASERAKEMLDAGAVFYLTKSGPAADLKAAIRTCIKEKIADKTARQADSQRLKD